MRINVFISSTGFCSRREADRLIAAGKVMVDGKPALVGMEIETHNHVTMDGVTIGLKPQTVYLAFNKPEGIVSTTDQTKPNNIIDFIGYPERIFPIGRLDKDTSGLILLTNDGQIVNKILRSENEHEKEYWVELDHPFDADFVDKMQTGVQIYNPVRHESVTTKPSVIKPITSKSFKLIITQGLNLQIRRMCSALGYRVVKLERHRIMNISLATLPIGQWRHLTAVEMETMMKRLS